MLTFQKILRMSHPILPTVTFRLGLITRPEHTFTKQAGPTKLSPPNIHRAAVQKLHPEGKVHSSNAKATLYSFAIAYLAYLVFRYTTSPSVPP
jgi:hypothetical protein